MQKDKKYIVIIVIILLLSLILISTVYYFKYVKESKENQNNTNISNNVNDIGKADNDSEETPKIEQPKIFSGSTRAVAVMIDNEKPAWPHSGLADAYMIYEAIIEGGETRLMAIFKNKLPEKIGPIRSARHYFVSFALEHDAIFTHFGWSPQAENLITQNDVNNINGVTSDYKIFSRIGSGYHNAYTSLEKILNLAKQKGYFTTSADDPIYQISTKEYDLSQGMAVNNVYIEYSKLHNVSYVYDQNQKVFLRSMRSIKDVDRETGLQYFAKNIIIIKANNYTLNDGENKGRQQVDIVGSGTGYYLTNGKYIDITWKKDSIKSKTYIYDKSGNQITLNDGITYVQVVPISNQITLS